MLPEILGQPGALSLLENFLDSQSPGDKYGGEQNAQEIRSAPPGRTVLLQGEKGTGKFTAAVRFARSVLGVNPFFSPDFLFYRNDDYFLKTRFFLKNLKNQALQPRLAEYFSGVLGRLSQAVALGEVGKSGLKFRKNPAAKSESYQLPDFQTDLERILLSENPVSALQDMDAAMKENLSSVSEEISKKKRVPIDFIRSVIAFHSLKSSSGRRITVIGDFDNATEEAQNAALKLFEEPAPGSWILLTSARPDSLLPTILSRCVRISFQALTPRLLESVLGIPAPERARTTADVLEDTVHQYTRKAREKVAEFFTQIAPRIQYENRVFEFIESVSDSGALQLRFLDELAEFLRGVFLARQSRIRGSDLTGFLAPEYREACARAAGASLTAELKELSASVADAAEGIRHRNLSGAAVLPAVLIDAARWYQKRTKSPA